MRLGLGPCEAIQMSDPGQGRVGMLRNRRNGVKIQPAEIEPVRRVRPSAKQNLVAGAPQTAAQSNQRLNVAHASKTDENDPHLRIAET